MAGVFFVGFSNFWCGNFELLKQIQVVEMTSGCFMCFGDIFEVILVNTCWRLLMIDLLKADHVFLCSKVLEDILVNVGKTLHMDTRKINNIHKPKQKATFPDPPTTFLYIVAF